MPQLLIFNSMFKYDIKLILKRTKKWTFQLMSILIQNNNETTEVKM